jgi:site-specific recombinase XerD
MQFFITEENIIEYITYLKNEEHAESTVEKYVRDTRAFGEFLNGEAVTKEVAIVWKNSLNANYAPESINSMIASVNSFFKFKELDIKLKPLKIQKKTFKSDEKILTFEEYQRILRAAKAMKKERIFHIIETICATGIRVSELKFITVETVTHGFAEVTNKGKTRTIFIPDDLRKSLLNYAKKLSIKSGYIFVTKSGNPVDRSNIWSEMKKLCKAANVNPSKVFPHALRALFARMFYKVDKDLSKLADMLGHSNLNTTMIYIMDSGVQHRRIVESLGLAKMKYAN